MHNIPTTIVTGFLGAGKTTAINHLLAQKPHREHWAVLVNEFGKVGVDAALIGPVAGVSIREIAGGCLCCTAQVAFEVALNRRAEQFSCLFINYDLTIMKPRYGSERVYAYVYDEL